MPPQPTNITCTPTSGGGALPSGDAVILDTSMYSKFPESQIFDLYGIGSIRTTHTSIPFIYGVKLQGPKGEIVRMRSVFDDGAMVNAIDADVFAQVRNRLSALQPSSRLLRMADGRIVGSEGVWSGMVSVDSAQMFGDFEVFKSGNAWALLFGKPLLEGFRAIHDYGPDEIEFPTENGPIRIQNQFADTSGLCSTSLVGLTIDIKQCERFQGESNASPSKQPTESDWTEYPSSEGDEDHQSVSTVTEAAGTNMDYQGVAQPELPKERDTSTYT